MSSPDDPTTPAERAPVKRREPIFDAPFVVVALVLALLAIHAGVNFLSDASQDALIRRFAFMPGRLTLAIWPSNLGALLARANDDPEALNQAAILRHFHVLEDGAAVWTLLTYAFLHGSWTHVGLNSVWIIAFGPPVARRIGPWRFLALFAATAIAGALVHWAFNWMDFTPLIGASAADSGLMAAAARFIFTPGGPLAGPDGYSRSGPRVDVNVAAPPLRLLLRERRVVMFLAVWLVANFVFGAGSQIFGFTDGPVAWLAHVGGFAMGLFAFPLFDRPQEPG
jgi:membrane associated rhomboid family serine protease